MEQFIEKVRNKPCLWNVNYLAYRDIARKELAWERIAKECGMTNANEAKSQWKKLRDSHREALRRRNPTYGPAAQTLRPWKYEEAMKFLITPVVKTPTVEFNTSGYSETHENVNKNKPDVFGDENEKDITDFKDSEYMTSVIEAAESICAKEFEPGKGNDETLDSIGFRDKNKEEKQRERQRQLNFDVNRVPRDALSLLFESLCQKTRELPKYLQLRVQREIFNSVSLAEEDALSLDCINSTTVTKPDYNKNRNSVNNIPRHNTSIPEFEVVANTREQHTSNLYSHTSTTVKIEPEYASSPSPSPSLENS